MFTNLTRPKRDEAGSGVNESYLEAGRRGKNTWPRYLLGVVFILFMWFVVGGWASLSVGSLLGVSAGQIATEPSSVGPIAGYLVISASFVPFLLSTLLAVTLIHRRNALTLVTGRRTVDWSRVGTGFGVLFVLVVLSTFVEFLIYTDRFVPVSNLVQFLAAAALFYLAVFVLFKRRPDRSTRNVS
jgi:uncharacterized protein